MNGIVSGGWNFVWAAYSVSALVLAAYCAHVVHGFFKTLASAEHGAKGVGQ
jgi:heme exporter protein D